MRILRVILALVAASTFSETFAWSLNLTAAPRRVFLHVGAGTLFAANGTIQTVSVTLVPNAVGNGVAQSMRSNSTQSASVYDGYITCPTPANNLFIGASYQRSSAADGPDSATLTVTTPANLVNEFGDTIPFSQISWTVSASGSLEPNVIPAGTYAGATQTLATIPANKYFENCHSYKYQNAQVVPAGTYVGRAVYTISSP